MLGVSVVYLLACAGERVSTSWNEKAVCVATVLPHDHVKNDHAGASKLMDRRHVVVQAVMSPY
jgi:hypothetical protein